MAVGVPVPGLASARWTGLPERPLVLVPVGSTEQHGPHLPTGTDTCVAEAVTHQVAPRLAERLPAGIEVVVAPPIHYGASDEHHGFPGVMSVGTEVLREVVVALSRSVARWAGRVVFVNGHAGNIDALGAAMEQLRGEGLDACWVPCATRYVDAHAGHTETSLMLHLAPETVRMADARRGNCSPIRELMPVLLEHGVVSVAPDGVLGDPTAADAAKGERLLAGLVRDVTDRVLADVRDSRGCLSRPGFPPFVSEAQGGRS